VQNRTPRIGVMGVMQELYDDMRRAAKRLGLRRW
jgi:hypothetical protein